MDFIAIIPARYQSIRFPGKPLAMLGEKPIIQWVYENAKKTMSDVFVATDDKRIFNTVEQFGGKAICTSPHHPCGTDRCAEAAQKVAEFLKFDVVINIQGDEAFIGTEQIEELKNCFRDSETEIATLIKPIVHQAEVTNINRPKVVINKQQEAMYFSRSTIPFIRYCPIEEWMSQHILFSHIGIYAYRYDILMKLTQLPASALEKAESLEQLRWLENGYRIKTAKTSFENIAIDTPEDLENARKFFYEREKCFS
jgi:3-deoxy-manno-octulosonate cytidylyltransferase (CMP-KDO synthetase)